MTKARAKAKARYSDRRGPLQRMYDQQASECDDATPNEFAQRQGDYQPRGKFNGARRMFVNRGGTPVARWTAAGLLSDSQIAAIAHCERLWSRLNGRPIVANIYSAGISSGRTHSDGLEEQEALDSFARMKAYVPMKYWSIFEGVCRFDEPAGMAGSQLVKPIADQATAARVVVQFVADIIAMKERLSY